MIYAALQGSVSTASLFAAAEFEPFTKNVTAVLVEAGCVSADSVIAEKRDFLFNSATALQALSRADEKPAQTIIRFHERVAWDLNEEQVPPFLSGLVETLSAQHSFDEFVSNITIYMGRLLLRPIAHIEGQEILVPFIENFAAITGEKYDFSPFGGFSELAGKEDDFLRDIYFIMSGTALYDSREEQDYIVSKLRGEINFLHLDDLCEETSDELPLNGERLVEERIESIVWSIMDKVTDSDERTSLLDDLDRRVTSLHQHYGTFHGGLMGLTLLKAYKNADLPNRFGLVIQYVRQMIELEDQLDAGIELREKLDELEQNRATKRCDPNNLLHCKN